MPVPANMHKGLHALIRALLLLLILLPVPLMALDCTPAAIELSSQTEVDNFQQDHGPGCDTITGSLYIFGEDITNLKGLRDLKAVSSWMQVENTSISDFGDLESLQTVGGFLAVKNNQSIASLDGLLTLTSAGSIVISANPVLDNIQALSSVTGGTYQVAISQNDSLRNLDGLSGIEWLSGYLRIYNNGLLENIDALSSLTSIAGTVELESNPSLQSISGLSAVAYIGGSSVSIYGNQSLALIDSFDQVTNLEDVYLRIAANQSLTEIAGFDSLESAGLVKIDNNPSLERIAGFSSLKNIWKLDIAFAPNLVDLSGFRNLQNADNLSLAALGALESLTDFSGLSQVGGLFLSDNSALTTLDGLDSLHTAESVSVTRCNALANLSGLENIEIQTGISLNQNSGLLSLNGLNTSQAEAAYEIYVAFSPNLSDISALSGFTALGRLSFHYLDKVTSLNALSGLETVSGGLGFGNMQGLSDLSGMENLRSLGGSLWVSENDHLVSLSGLTNLESAGQVVITSNALLQHVTGLTNLKQVESLTIQGNQALMNLNGLDSLISVAGSAGILDNPALGNCSGLRPLIDEIDDGEPGPGPGASGIPDIGEELFLGGNNPSCNSREAILSDQPPVISTLVEVALTHTDDNPKTETVGLACDGVESVTTLSATANYYTAASFEVSWITGVNAACTATIISANSGYTPDVSDCESMALLDENAVNCTIVNNQDPVTVFVEKVFTDGNTMGVATSLSCSTGTVAAIKSVASSLSPAEFSVSEFLYSGPTCNAKEVLPSGYVQKENTCGAVSIGPGIGATCGFVNEPNAETTEFEFQVAVDFSDDNPQAVSTIVECEGATGISVVRNSATEQLPALFKVFHPIGEPVQSCSATVAQTVSGYNINESACGGVVPAGTQPGCVISLNQAPVSIDVSKEFTDGNPAVVEIFMECGAGDVLTTDNRASIGDVARFTVSNFPYAGIECTAAEIMPEGYEMESSTCDSILIVPGGDKACTITNAPQQELDASALTGSWYNPLTSGEGFMIHAVDDDTAVAYYYGYDNEGDRLWLIGQSDGLFQEGEPLLFEVLHVVGGAFTNFDIEQVIRSEWGIFEVELLDCDNALVQMFGSYGEKTLEVTRLARTSGTKCFEDESIYETDAVTGSWFEPETSGQGFSIHKIAVNRGVIYFYGYNDAGENHWLIGVWETAWNWGDEIVIPMQQASGGTFGQVIPEDIVREDWGTLTVRFDDCFTGWARLDGLDGSQELDLVLLAGSLGLECQPIVR